MLAIIIILKFKISVLNKIFKIASYNQKLKIGMFFFFIKLFKHIVGTVCILITCLF